ncbi:MAG: hypothetical protein E7193_05935 [Erysipelotrichaceae bacterium]|nr:hypothetical protein [Erysipelotrichaceae bacterium]
MIFSWVDGFELSVKVEDGTVVISGNKEGLLSLANHLTTLADEEGNDHFHLDEHNSLVEGSAELIVEKVD